MPIDPIRGEREEPLRVLIAEDETIIRLDLRALLERMATRSAARRATERKPSSSRVSSTPTSPIMDVRMPQLDGVEAARRIHAERPVPIVMLTAFDRRLRSRARSRPACSATW